MTHLPRRTPREPLLDDLGRAIVEGRQAASYLWQVPDDETTRADLRERLETIKRLSGHRREMPMICADLLLALRVEPSPQQVDLLQDGFDRLYKLWSAAKSGLL
jgi:hypothetical protein